MPFSLAENIPFLALPVTLITFKVCILDAGPLHVNGEAGFLREDEDEIGRQRMQPRLLPFVLVWRIVAKFKVPFACSIPFERCQARQSD